MPDKAHRYKVGTGSVGDLGLLPVDRTGQGHLADDSLHLAAGLHDREDRTAGGYAATLVSQILQMPPYNPAVDDTLVSGALALIESLES